MDGQPNIGTAACPPTEESVLAEARQAFEELVCFCLGEERTFWEFEKRLLVLLFGLGRVLTRLQPPSIAGETPVKSVGCNRSRYKEAIYPTHGPRR